MSVIKNMKVRNYSQGVMLDGAAILCDGEKMTIDEIVSRLNSLELNVTNMLEKFGKRNDMLFSQREACDEAKNSIS